MLKNFRIIFISLAVTIAVLFAGAYAFAKLYNITPVEEEEMLGGMSSPARDVIGTTGSPTATSSAPSQLNADNDLAAVATSTARVALLGSLDPSGSVERDSYTDSVIFTIDQEKASTTNEFYWHITGSNDLHCDTIATSTTDDNYDATEALTGDIRWYSLVPDDIYPSGYGNYGSVNASANATGTAILLANVNWNCLRVDYRGASTTVLMQLKEKILFK